jgi:cyclase
VRDRHPRSSRSLFWAAGTLLFAAIAGAQQSSDPLDVVRIRPNFYMIAGAGSNIAVQTGPDGTVLVDAGTAEAAGQLLATIQKLSDQPIRYVLNTGADADHVGGNAKLSQGGRSFLLGTNPYHPDILQLPPLNGPLAKTTGNPYPASIMAPESVLRRMSAPTGKVSPFPGEGWPTESFADKRRYIYLNHEGIEMFRQPNAHSDADSIVFFRASDVIAAGDIIDVTRFPLIDLENGGSISGEIAALNRVIELAVRPIPLPFQGGGTYIIPGHGRVLTTIDVVDYRDMIVTLRDIIQDMMQRGMTLEQIYAASPTKAYEPLYGSNSHDFIRAIYQSLTKKS